MTLWLDAQLDPELAAWLGSRFKVVAKSLWEIGLRNADDVEIFEAAGRFERVVIVTKDRDLPELVSRRGAPPQVLWLRIRNAPTIAIQVILAKAFPEALRLLESGEPLVEITETGN